MTKNHPTEALSVYQQINGCFSGDKDFIAISPQAVALMIEEIKGYPFLDMFYPALHQVEEAKEEIASKYKDVVVVGTAATTSKSWFDAIIGINNAYVSDYKNFDEDFNVHKYKILTLKDADILFNTMNEVVFFLKHMMRVNKENEV